MGYYDILIHVHNIMKCLSQGEQIKGLLNSVLPSCDKAPLCARAQLALSPYYPRNRGQRKPVGSQCSCHLLCSEPGCLTPHGSYLLQAESMELHGDPRTVLRNCLTT